MSRIDTAELRAALEVAEQHLRQALAAMDPLLVALTEEGRRDLPRPPGRFPEAARAMARLAGEAPDLARRASFDAPSVLEDLENVAALGELSGLVDRLRSRLDDSRLCWLAEAYLPALALYGMSKAGARHDPSLRALAEPLADMYAQAKRREPREG